MEFNRPTNIIPAPWAENGQYETIPATQVSSGRASWDTGFPLENTIPVSSGGIPANYQDFQGVLHDLSEHTCFQQTGGLYAWTSSIDYPVGAIVQGGDAKTYQAVAKNGPNTSVVNPTTDSSGSCWNTFVMTGGSQTINGAKAFTSSAVFSGGITVSGTISGTATSATSAGSATNASSLGGIAASGYVTTSGAQTISGTTTFTDTVIVTNDTTSIKRSNNTGGLRLAGGTGVSGNEGAFITLFGASHASNPGYFRVYAQTKLLEGKPDGTLTWSGKGFVYDSGDQTIGGEKTFSNIIKIESGTPIFSLNRTGSTSYSDIRFAISGTMYATMRQTSTTFQIGAKGSGSNWYDGPSIYVNQDNTFSINSGYGSSKYELKGSASGSLTWRGNVIQTTSDERIKTAFSDVPNEILDAWGTIAWEQYKYKDAVKEKGENNCRWHTGLVAQHIQRAFEAQKQDALKYGILCFDEWDAEYADNDDGTKTLTKEAGDQWTVRYEEALCMEAAYQRRRADRAEARISALEQRLGELEAVLASLISPISEEQAIEPEEPVIEETPAQENG